MKSKKRILSALSAATFSAVALGALAPHVACAPVLGIESDPQVTGFKCQGTLDVRIASDFSGTATDIAIPHFFGIYDYLRKLNDSGGLRGCNVAIQVQDNKYDPSTTETVVDNWRSTDPQWSNVSTLFIFGTGPTTRVGPTLMTEKKLIIPGSYAGSLASPTPVQKSVSYPTMNDTFQTSQFPESKSSPGWPYIFFPATDYGTAIRIAIQAMWNISPGRIAFAHDDANACLYCVDPLAAGKSYVGSLQGMSIGRDLLIPQTSDPSKESVIADAVNQYFQKEIAQVVADPTYQPVSWVWSGNSVYASSILGKYVYAAQQAINSNTQIPAATKQKWQIRVIANNWGIGETTAGFCGDACNHDNFYGLFPVPRYGDINTAQSMAELIALHDEYANKDTTAKPPIPARTVSDFRDVRYVQGYAAALMWRKAVEAAIDAGHTSPTGDDIKSALEKFKNVDMAQMTAGPITFSAADHRPQSTEVVYKLDPNGQFTFVNTYSIELVPDWLGY